MPSSTSSLSRNTSPSKPRLARSSLRALLTATSQLLAEAGLDSPRLTAELLLCHVLGLSRLELLLRGELPVPAAAYRRLRRLLQRRLQREPLQYLLGTTEFYDLRLRIRPGVFIPRPETELLVEEALTLLRTQPWSWPVRILDIGTGSGCIALALAHHFPEASVCAIDISPAALRLARENARRLGLSCVRFRRMDILHRIPPGSPFHLVVANPPYIPAAAVPHLQPEVCLYEPRAALTDEADGQTFYRRFAYLFPRLLVPGGAFVLELGDTAAEAVTELFGPIAAELRLRRDYAGTERVLIGILGPSPTPDPAAVR